MTSPFTTFKPLDLIDSSKYTVDFYSADQTMHHNHKLQMHTDKVNVYKNRIEITFYLSGKLHYQNFISKVKHIDKVLITLYTIAGTEPVEHLAFDNLIFKGIDYDFCFGRDDVMPLSVTAIFNKACWVTRQFRKVRNLFVALTH